MSLLCVECKLYTATQKYLDLDEHGVPQKSEDGYRIFCKCDVCGHEWVRTSPRTAVEHLSWDVDGITIFDDGTRMYWTEGRSSSVLIRYPDKSTEWVPVHISHPVLDDCNITEYYGCGGREMTCGERTEYEFFRGHWDNLPVEFIPEVISYFAKMGEKQLVDPESLCK